jgi:hypothetical protein
MEERNEWGYHRQDLTGSFTKPSRKVQEIIILFNSSVL